MSMSETLQLPEWSDRITVRHGHRAEVIVRVPHGTCACNHILTIPQAIQLRIELQDAINAALVAEALNPNPAE